jgi:hypothetical protein
MCCGERPSSPDRNRAPGGWVQIRYLENSPVLVRGPATGRQYQFSGAAPVQAVEQRDAQALLRTRLFRSDTQ